MHEQEYWIKLMLILNLPIAKTYHLIMYRCYRSIFLFNFIKVIWTYWLYHNMQLHLFDFKCNWLVGNIADSGWKYGKNHWLIKFIKIPSILRQYSNETFHLRVHVYTYIHVYICSKMLKWMDQEKKIEKKKLWKIAQTYIYGI